MTGSSLPAATTTANCEAVLDEIQRVVVGKRWALTLILTSVLARGHVLIEDLPGLGKTLIARSFAAALGLQFTRVQFTPDLLPADLLGSTVYDMDEPPARPPLPVLDVLARPQCSERSEVIRLPHNEFGRPAPGPRKVSAHRRHPA